jgi:hypothetical protein
VDPEDELRRIACNPGDELCALRREEPAEDAPVHRQTAWHNRMAELWEQLAQCDPVMARNARFTADLHRRKVKELGEQPPRNGRAR